MTIHHDQIVTFGTFRCRAGVRTIVGMRRIVFLLLIAPIVFAQTPTVGSIEIPNARIGYIAYTKEGASRPLLFAFNGGPGSSSTWLHMGILGPRRVVIADASVQNNPWTILDKADLVLIDPVGTGTSVATGNAQDKDFWNVDADTRSVAAFITRYVNLNGRWASPKFILGESYGSIRAALVVDTLQESGMSFNGVILVAPALTTQAIFFGEGNDLPFAFHIPTYAALAQYHGVTAPIPLKEVREFALGPYATALLRGDSLDAAERQRIVELLHRYTGLSTELIDRANLRIGRGQFAHELLRRENVTLGILDGRFKNRSIDPLAMRSSYDPSLTTVDPAFTAAFFDYYHRELHADPAQQYVVLNLQAAETWTWIRGDGFYPVNAALSLGHALVMNPQLRVLMMAGLYDLQTPFLSAEYMADHLGAGPEARARVEVKNYPAGHMMYVNDAAARQFKADVAALIERATRAPDGSGAASHRPPSP